MGRLYVRLDLADADAPIQLLTATGNSLPALEQDSDVNFTNGAYEMELATFDVGVSSLSNVAMTYETIVGTKAGFLNVVSNTMENGTTIAANGGTAWLQVYCPSGYTPIGIVGYYLNGGSGCSVYNMGISSDPNGYFGSFALRNGQSTANTVKVTAYFLCRRS